MQKLALTVIASAAILFGTAWSSSEASGIRPGYYAYSQLVYGNAERHYAAGCLRWGWHNLSWYNYCCASKYRHQRKDVVSAKY